MTAVRNIIFFIGFFVLVLVCISCVKILSIDSTDIFPTRWYSVGKYSGSTQSPKLENSHSGSTQSPKLENNYSGSTQSPKLENSYSESTLSPKLESSQDNMDGRDIWFSTFLLIIVPIRPTDKEARQSIRDTWFKGFRKNSTDVALRFAIGTKTLEAKERLEYTKENETFADIIFVDTMEKETLLTNKTLAIIDWAHWHVKHAYFMKCDDDAFVNVKELVIELRKRPTTTGLYYGRIITTNEPVRGNGKWADNDWNLGPKYLPFMMGTAYILSHDLVDLLTEQAPHLKWHVNEDTAVGAWLSAFDIEERHDERFCYWWKGTNLKWGCIWSQCDPPMLTFMFHGFNRNELHKLFTHFCNQLNSNLPLKVDIDM